jgi:hypothetical protein
VPCFVCCFAQRDLAGPHDMQPGFPCGPHEMQASLGPNQIGDLTVGERSGEWRRGIPGEPNWRLMGGPRSGHSRCGTATYVFGCGPSGMRLDNHFSHLFD